MLGAWGTASGRAPQVFCTNASSFQLMSYPVVHPVSNAHPDTQTTMLGGSAIKAK